MSGETNVELLIDSLAAVFGSGLLGGIFVIGLALILLCVFLLVSVSLVYVITYAWAGYEKDFDDGDEKKARFDENEVFLAVNLALDQLADALGSVVEFFVSVGSSVVSFITANIIEFIVFAFLFILVIEWDTNHNILLGFWFEFEACFINPLFRTFLLPLANSIAVIVGFFLPLLDVVRELQVSVVTETIIDVLICASRELLPLLFNVSQIFIAFALALTNWLQMAATSPNPRLVRANFFPVGRQLGLTLNSLDAFANCTCEPAFVVAIEPLFEPFNSTQFAQAVNSTLSIVPIFITDVVQASVVRSFQNSASMPGAPLSSIIVRPSFNTTLDAAINALNNTGQVIDLFLRADVIAIRNIIGLLIDTCAVSGGQLLCIPPYLDAIPPYPAPGLATALFGLPIEVVQFVKYLLNIITNVDIVFGTLTGYRFFNIDDTLGATFIDAARNLVAAVSEWPATVLEGIGAFLRTIFALTGPPSQSLALRGTPMFGDKSIDRVLQTEGSAISFALELGATVFRVFGQFILRAAIAIESLVSIIVDLLVGTIYGMVRTAEEFGFPDPLFFAKDLFNGDLPLGADFQCRVANVSGINLPRENTTLLFTAHVLNTSMHMAPCTERTEVLEYCRFVFRQALVVRTDTAALAPTPDYLSVFEFGSEGILVPSIRCQTQLAGCAVSVYPVIEGVSLNRFEDVVRNFVEIVQVFDPLIDVLGISEAHGFFRNVTEPFVPFIVFFIDPIVHLRELVTTIYVACLNVEGVLDAAGEFVRAFTNLVRAFEDAQPNAPPCPMVLRAEDTRLLCTVPQAIDATVDIGVETVRSVWLTFTSAVRLIDMSRNFTSVQNMFSLTTVEGDVHDLAFGVLATLAFFVPDRVRCSDNLSATIGCCVARIGDGPDTGARACIERQTTMSCNDMIRGNLPRSISRQVPIDFTVIADSLCNAAIGTVTPPAGVLGPLTCADTLPVFEMFPLQGGSDTTPVDFPTRRGCCAVFPANTNPTTIGRARNCVDLQSEFACRGREEIFFAGALCNSTAVSVDCPPVVFGNSAERVIVDSLATLISDAILAIPDTIIGVVRTIFRLITEGINTSNIANLPDTAFDDLVQSLLTPIVEAVLDVFVQAGRTFECLGAPVIQDILNTIADLLESVLEFGIQILSRLIFAIVLFGFGVIQVFQSFDWTLIGRAFEELLVIVARIALGLLGQVFTCGLQGAVCAFVSFFNFFGANIDKSRINFAINDCRRLDCCVYGIEPVNGLTAACCDTSQVGVCFNREPGIIFMCSNFTTTGLCDEESDQFHKRMTGEMPFALFIEQEFAAARNKLKSARSEPTDQFCGAFLATYTLERAQRLSHSDHTADALMVKKCMSATELSSLERLREQLIELAKIEIMPYVMISARSAREVHSHWAEMYHTASTAFESHKAAVERGLDGKAASDAVLAPVRAKSFGALMRGSKSSLRRRSVVDENNHSITRHVIIEVMHITMLLKYALLDRHEYVAMHRWFYGDGEDFRKRSVALVTQPPPAVVATSVSARSRAAAFKILAWHTRRTLHDVGVRMSAPLRRFAQKFAHVKPIRPRRPLMFTRVLPKYQQRFVEARDAIGRPFRILANESGQIDLIVPPRLIDAFTLPPCNTTFQLCTNCLILDNLIQAATIGVNSLIVFYPNTQFGYASYVRRFEEGIDNTLTNPFGNDTYTTDPKTVPWIGQRFLTVRWFWQWDYSEFLSIIDAGTPGMQNFNELVGTTETLQMQRAAAAGRIDQDNMVYALLKPAIEPAINALERTISALDTLPNTETLSRLVERYVVCDYAGALQCHSDLGVGLFDALANVILVYAIIALVISAILPMGVGTLAIMMIPFGAVFYILVMWVAYGASPLCTLPSFIFMIPGVPTCLPADIYTLLSETFPQCPPVPIAMIEPAALAEASTTLCATCGTVPPLVNCAVAGFLNGLDNIFYTLTAVFGGEPDAILTRLFSGTLPSVASVAALYTPEYVASLGELGADCNRVTFPNVITASFLLGFLAAVALVAAGIAAAFGFIVLGLYYVTAYAINVEIRQMDEGFVQNTRVKKLKQE